jgi:hypothetical protein
MRQTFLRNAQSSLHEQNDLLLGFPRSEDSRSVYNERGGLIDEMRILRYQNKLPISPSIFLNELLKPSQKESTTRFRFTMSFPPIRFAPFQVSSGQSSQSQTATTSGSESTSTTATASNTTTSTSNTSSNTGSNTTNTQAGK